MKKLIYISTLILCQIISFHQVSAQEEYRTQNGTMIITVISSDTVLKLTTKELLIILNYDNAKFTMKMDKSTFYSTNDSLNKKLALMKYDIITYKGKLDIDRVNTIDHPPLDFTVEGIISTTTKSLKGTGHMDHLSSRGIYSCLLTLKFNLNTDDLGLNLEGLNLKDDVQIEIVQTVLNKTKDQ